MTRDNFKKANVVIHRRVDLLLKAGAACQAPKVSGRCYQIHKMEQASVVFSEIEGVHQQTISAKEIFVHLYFGEKSVLRPGALRVVDPRSA